MSSIAERRGSWLSVFLAQRHLKKRGGQKYGQVSQSSQSVSKKCFFFCCLIPSTFTARQGKIRRARGREEKRDNEHENENKITEMHCMGRMQCSGAVHYSAGSAEQCSAEQCSRFVLFCLERGLASFRLVRFSSSLAWLAVVLVQFTGPTNL